MGDSLPATPSAQRLLSVIDLQNAIAAAAMNGDEVMRVVGERAATLTSAAGAAVAVVEGDGLISRASWGSSRLPPGTRIELAATLPAECVKGRRAIRIDDVAADVRVDPQTRGRVVEGAMIVVPILYGEHAVGTLEVASARRAAFKDEDVETLQLLAQIIAIALHRAYTFPRPRRDSQHDASTGLANRRAFDDRIAAELARFSRYGHAFSLAMFELDGLNTFADRAGQAAGDQLIREVATVLMTYTRMIDVCFRLGGDEFAIVMPGTSLEGAKVLAERCRASLAEAKIGDDRLVPSIGVVEASNDSSESVTARAIAARDADKRSHRA